MKTLHTIYSTFAKHNMAKYLTVLTILFTVGVGQMLGETATYTLSTSDNGKTVTTSDVQWTIAASAIESSSSKCKLTGTITVSLPTGATLDSVELVSNGNGWGSGATITFKAGTTTLNTFSSCSTFTLTKNETDLTYSFVKSGTSSKNAWVKSITVNYTAAPSCSVKPTVGTSLQSVTVTENSITATIPISSIGGCNITENGLVYSTTNSTPTVGGSGCTKVTTTACGSTAANKTVTITGLTCGQSYYIRGYATNEAGASYTNVTTKSTSDCPKYTVTLKDDNSILTQSTAGGSVTLPTREGCAGYTFAGWTSTWTSEQSNWTTTKPTIINAGAYTPTKNVDLYPVYTKTAGGGTAYEKVTTLTEGVYVMVSEKTSGIYKYMPNTTSSGSNPTLGAGITMNNGKTSLTNDITEAMLWDLTATGTANQYYLRPHGSTTIGLGCTTSTGANIRISSSYKDVKWTISISTDYGWQFKSNASTPMYLAVYTDDYWRNYKDATTNQNGKFYLFKQTSSSITSYISVPNCCTQLAEVTNLVFSGITSSSITVSVPENYSDKENVSGYIFNLYNAQTGGSVVQTGETNSKEGISYTFTGLTKNTTYYFTVIAKGEDKYCNSIETSPRESSKTLAQYTVILNPNGGSGTFTGWTANGSNYTKTVDAGTQITLPTLSKTGYNFAGWHDGGTTVASSYTPTKDITLTAQWEAVVYDISYEGLEGASNNADNPGTYTIESETITFLPPGERTGYKFTGWTPTSITKGSTGNKTVTANWTAKALVNYRTTCLPIYEVTLNPDGGTIADNEWGYDNTTGYYTKKVIKGYTVNLPVATKAGYTNTGWKTDPTTNVVSNPYTVNGNVTLIAAYDCALASVGISGTYALTVGDVFELVATAYDSNGDVLTCPANTTYSWERYNSVKEEWEVITDDNSDGDDAKLTFNNCQIANCGTYRCHVTYGDCGAWSQGYNVHCFHLKGTFEGDWNKEYAFNHTDEEGIATLSMDLLTGQTFEFKIYDGITQYGNGGTIETSVTGWTYGTDNQSNTIFKTGADGTYIFKLDFKRLINSENILVLDVTYPPANQAAGHTIYYDNLVHKWENVYYRIGHNRDNGDGTWGWNQNQKMTLVPGTSHLYKTTTPTFDNFEAWHIANNVSWADRNSIYLVNPDGTEYDITHASVFKKFVVVEDITLTPEATGTFVNDENCTYYADVKQSGMKMHKATVIPATGGTITVSYTDHDGTAKSDFTSGDRDLAHTCLLKITATPDDGYSLGTLTVNNVPFTSGNVHTLAEDAVIKVVWNTNQYTVSFDGNGADGGSTASVSGNYLTTVTLTPNGFTRTGYTFSGWNTKSDGTGTPYADGATFNILPQDVILYAQWEKAYIVEFSHNDKGIFNGEEIVYVPTNDNIITLPTVEDVSCGFYDTFEGWIISNDEYVESTTKPATVYAGGASYKVTGDCTFRALYSKCEGDATQVYRKVTSTGEVTDGTYILVATTTTGTSYVYSGNGGNTYGLYVSGLTTDAGDFSSTLPDGTDPISITVNDGKFAMYNANESKYLTYTGSNNTLNTSDSEANVWKLTDGSEKINEKACPAGALTPSNNTRVLQYNTGQPRFACYKNTDNYPYVFLYKLIDKCTKYYSTNPSCEKPVGVHIVYNANAVDASMSCNTQDRTYKVVSGENQYPELASQLQFCTNATREGYTLAGWNTQANGQGTTYNINQNYYRLPVSGDLDDDNWITLNLYAVWKQSVKFDLGNATGGTGVPDAVVENGECVLPEPTAEQLGTIPCAYEFYAWSETSVNATQSKPTVWMPGDTYTGSATTLYAVYRYAEGMGGSDTYYFTFNKSGKTYCITAKHNSYDRFVVAEQSTGLIFGLENGYLYYLDEGVKTFVYWEGDGTTVTTTTTYPNNANQKTTFVEGDNGTTIVTPAISGRYLQMPSSYTDRAYYTNDGINPTLVEVEAATYTYATNPTCYTTANLHFVTNGGTLNYPTSYDETNYQDLTAGSTVFLPTATFAGEWTFEGWKRGAPLESTTTKPYDPSFYPVTLNTTQFEVDEVGDIYFYAVYSKTVDDKQFDEVNGGTYKLYAIGADGTKTYMPIWAGGRGTMSGVTECYQTGDYTITPGTGEHAGHYQITCGGHTLGVVSANTDLKEVEGTWWNIKPSESGKGTWRITVVGSTDDRALSCLFSTAKSFGNYALSQVNSSTQSIYRDMEIGECIFTEYTSTPENIPYITITGAPVKITSTNGERVYASTTIHIEAHNFTGERIIHLSATNGFGVDPVQVRTNGQGVYSGNVKVYYEPTTDGDGQTITTSVLTAAQTGGTNAEKISQTFSNIQGRNLPANFVIAAKWDGHWYALPANCTSSLSSTEGLLIEVDDVDNPTRATQAPASAKYGIREVIPSRQTDHGQGIVFTERYSEGNKEYSLYNGTSTNLQVYSQYSNYAATNPERYEWTPSTTDFVEYTLTNANSSRKITLNNSGVFSATTASGQVRLLPATFYEPAPVQVLKWKENSVIVMYTGAETTATTQVGTNAVSAAQTLENQKLTHGIYELTTTQALTGYARDVLVLYFGANTKVEMEIPLIVSGNVTASANGHDVVILENSKLTAAATNYSYKDVYVYGGGKLAVPASTSLGVNNIILRAGGIATNGAGADATYQYIYPQVELKGTFSSTKTDIKYEYVTDYDHWYHFVLPFDGNIKSITYPTEYYGDHVALDNTGSWVIKRYDGATRATGNYNAWVDIESEAATTTTAGKGYIFWGAPKKVSVNGGTKVRQQWGIQRITMPITSAAKAVEAETGDKTIEDLGSYANVANNSGKPNDQGWNLIGNPYMVNLTKMSDNGLKAGKLEKEIVDGNWTGKWFNNGDGIRYLTIPSDHFDTYEAKTVNAAITASNLVPGRAFFIQLEGEANGVTFSAANRASLLAARVAANEPTTDIETGIVLSNETMQDEVNFWIKDGKTNDYEYNADYPKTPNNTNFNIYGVHAHGDLSWVATGPEYAEESMPIGYQVPAAGTYMLSISETYDSDLLDALYVTDHALSPEVTVDLMSNSYEFSVNQAETNNERFTVSMKLKLDNEGTVTGLENTGVKSNQPIKFIYQDKIFILHNETIYDATGKKVTTINK